ncbi:hypothetical protein [Paenibacillus graminis]|uniref:hypothetical protein n=1 Tax=Paenibacillus graminis TaxID=189425 RepID=UPI0012DD916E|nr:hypothetical protein [Paenibacillus graminis]
MNLKRIITRRYGVYCPNCGHELSIYSTFSSNKFAVKCNECKNGYIFERNNNQLLPSTQTDEIEKLWESDEYHEYYKGIPTSEAFMPNWLKKHSKD